MSDRKDPQVDLEPEFRAAARAWAAQRERALTGHPESDALLAYQEGRLGEPEHAQVGDHVILCEACQEDLLALKAFDAVVPEGSPQLPSELDTRRSWQRFKQARASESQGPAAAWSHGQRWGWLTAALLALALGGMVLRDTFDSGSPKLVPEGSAVAELGSPFVFGLAPDGSAILRSAESLREVVIPAGAGPLVPTLKTGDLTTYDRYFAEVYDENDRQILRRENLARDHQGRITFLVERSSWPAGVWTVRLYGTRGSNSAGSTTDLPAPTELAAYNLRLRYAE